MSLKRAVAAPFLTRGTRRLTGSEVVVALSLDRDWFTPDQAQRLVDVAESEGLLARDGDALTVRFDPETVELPDGFVPEEDVLRERDAFERLLDALVEAGADKREAVAGINELQSELGVTVEAAAVVYARRQGLAVDAHAERALEELS